MLIIFIATFYSWLQYRLPPYLGGNDAEAEWGLDGGGGPGSGIHFIAIFLAFATGLGAIGHGIGVTRRAGRIYRGARQGKAPCPLREVERACERRGIARCNGGLAGGRETPRPPWFIGLGMILFDPIWVGAMTALTSGRPRPSPHGVPRPHRSGRDRPIDPWRGHLPPIWTTLAFALVHVPRSPSSPIPTSSPSTALPDLSCLGG